MLSRQQVFPETHLPDGKEVLDQGRALVADWQLGPSAFLSYYQVESEAAYKRQSVEAGRIGQHAHMGFRDKHKSQRAFYDITDKALQKNVRVDRIGLCLDWSMGFPRAMRDKQLRGTGLLLDQTQDFVDVANAAPAAAHFGDFVLGFPGALENTQSALAAGSTIIGNLGQYFTFRLPYWNDDIATTTATLQAIGLMSAQPVEVLVHSNLDDGFAAVFEDLSCALGAAMLERRIIEGLAGATITHCFGHHYSTPLLRLGFQKALSLVSPAPGSMIYGNTVRYQGDDAQNFASLAGYLQLDILSQRHCPSGHAINPVPVTENRRIPEIDEILDAQLFAATLVDASSGYDCFYESQQVDAIADKLVINATKFYSNVIAGFTEAGIDTDDAFEMMLAIRRIGGKRLEQLYGPGQQPEVQAKRVPVVESDTVREIHHLVTVNVAQVDCEDRKILSTAGLKVVVASTDVHEHSKLMLEGIFRQLGLEPIDGGVSADPQQLADISESSEADVIALSTYNGVALTYYRQLRDILIEKGLEIPLLIGGQLNEIPDDSTSSIPVDVESRLREEGASVCHGVLDAIPVLKQLLLDRH